MTATTEPSARCSYCGAAAGYAASCGEATVWVCKHHVGAACAIWLYDLGRTCVDVRKLRTTAVETMTDETADVQALCLRYGYGRVMQIASELWRQRDPIGAIALGECYGTLEARRARRQQR